MIRRLVVFHLSKNERFVFFFGEKIARQTKHLKKKKLLSLPETNSNRPLKIGGKTPPQKEIHRLPSIHFVSAQLVTEVGWIMALRKES